jgi:DNA repair exonuclease SbcCD ATPase subunit
LNPNVSFVIRNHSKSSLSFLKQTFLYHTKRLAFDELFGSQDEERRFQIMEALHTISESYRQIFLISHETEIKEMFERVVEL